MRRTLIVGSLLALGGCMTTQPVNYRPHYSNYSQLQSPSRCTVAVTEQSATDPRLDKLNVRAATLASPEKDGYAGLLASALNEEFGKAGIYAMPPQRALKVSMEKNKLDTPAGTGSAEIAMTVTVVDSNSNAQVALIPVAVRRTWKSAFMADAALNAAISEYTETIADLNGKLFADPLFQRATDCSANDTAGK